MSILKPSYATGYAKNASQSAHPNLWDGLVGAWMPSLGVTGETLRDVSGNGNHGTLNGMDAATDWVTTPKGLALDLTKEYVTIGNKPSLSTPEDVSVSITHTPESKISTTNWLYASGFQFGLEYARTTNIGYNLIWNTGSTFVIMYAPVAIVFQRPQSVVGIRRKTSSGFIGEIWVDGNKVMSQSTSYTNVDSYNTTYIGAYNSSNFQSPDTKINSVLVHNRALSPTEIKQLYVDSLAPFRTKKRTVVRVPAAIPAATVVGSIKKPTTIIKPSYQAGYARNASESENPKLWDGLVGAWMPSLGVTGETLRDVSGNGNHGDLLHPNTSDAWSATDKGIALDFSPTNSRVETSENVGIFGDSPRTLVTWFKTSQTNTHVNIAGYGVPTGKNLFDIYSYYNGTYYRVAGHFYGGGNNTESTFPNRNTVYFGKWNQVCLVYDGYNALVYANGIFSNQKVISGLNTTDAKLKIGIGNYTPTNVFNGKSSNTSIYNRALSPTEIKQLYVDSLAPFRKKQRVSVAVPAAVAPSATYHPLRSLAHPLEQ